MAYQPITRFGRFFARSNAGFRNNLNKGGKSVKVSLIL